ncbi:MAG: GNAT family N-acetyltransferase [Anaerolineales bacterium]
MSTPDLNLDFDKVYHNEQENRFEIRLGTEIAELTYARQGEKVLVLLHTGVPPAWEGRGIGSRLVKAALDYARQRGYKIIPLCPFVAAYLRRHPEYQDLVVKE